MPKPADTWVFASLLFASLCVLASIAATRLVLNAITSLGYAHWVFNMIAAVLVGTTAVLFWPALQSLVLSRKAAAARASDDPIQARIATAAARDKAQLTLGWACLRCWRLAFCRLFS